MKIKILNWEKHNPKRDQKTYTWLRLNNDISTDPDLFGLSAAEKFVWIEMLCQASRKNAGEISINAQQISHVCGVTLDTVLNVISFLQQKPIIRVTHDRARSPGVVPT